MKLWQVQGTRKRDIDFTPGRKLEQRLGYPSSGFTITELPTFYLDPNIQGLVNEEQVRKVAQDICGPGCEFVVMEVEV